MFPKNQPITKSTTFEIVSMKPIPREGVTEPHKEMLDFCIECIKKNKFTIAEVKWILDEIMDYMVYG